MKAMKMSEGGRVVVPAEIRKAMDLHDGDIVYWELIDGEARLTTKLARLRRSQELIQSLCPNARGMSVVEEFVADRHRDAASE